MTAPVRTWIEKTDEDSEVPCRWEMLMDGKPVEGAYIDKLDEETYDLHFPRLKPTTAASLSMAKRLLELAPLPKTTGVRIARVAKETDSAAFVSTAEAASELDVAPGRINAMVANGVLSARRIDGQLMISVSSLRARLEGNDEGPQGVFANKFVQFYPDQDADEFYLAEVDVSDDEALDQAESFVEFVRDNERNPGGARLVSFRAAAKLKHKEGWTPVTPGAGVEAFDWDTFVVISETAEAARKQQEEEQTTRQDRNGGSSEGVLLV